MNEKPSIKRQYTTQVRVDLATTSPARLLRDAARNGLPGALPAREVQLVPAGCLGGHAGSRSGETRWTSGARTGISRSAMRRGRSSIRYSCNEVAFAPASSLRASLQPTDQRVVAQDLGHFFIVGAPTLLGPQGHAAGRGDLGHGSQSGVPVPRQATGESHAVDVGFPRDGGNTTLGSGDVPKRLHQQPRVVASRFLDRGVEDRHVAVSTTPAGATSPRRRSVRPHCLPCQQPVVWLPSAP